MDIKQKVKNLLKRVLPKEIINCYRKLGVFLLHFKNNNKSASQVFSEIYSKNKWGGKPGEFYSGVGSEGLFARKYCEVIDNFIDLLGENDICIVDLGCGDFRVGIEIAKIKKVNYVGVDVVPELVKMNNDKYGNQNIKFLCLDIATAELPDGDVCLIRQVLQHLSNEEIKKIINKIKKYKYVFITESQPSQAKTYNEDKPHGPDTRLLNGSGVYLDRSPFNVKNIEQIMSIPCLDGEEINTFLIKNI